MNVFGIGLPELAVIAAIALLVFGPKRLPEMGRSLGKTLRGFQSASQEFERELRQGMASTDEPSNAAVTPALSAAEAPASEDVIPAPTPSPQTSEPG